MESQSLTCNTILNIIVLKTNPCRFSHSVFKLLLLGNTAKTRLRDVVLMHKTITNFIFGNVCVLRLKYIYFVKQGINKKN